MITTASAVRADTTKDHCWIRNWRDLEPFGIKALTGEACPLSRRLLCDVTDDGKAILLDTLGLPPTSLPENWNSGSSGSFMCPHGLFQDLAITAMVRAGYEKIYLFDSGAVQGASGETMRETDEHISSEVAYNLAEYERNGRFPNAGYFSKIRVIHNPRRFRNTHAMTGRDY